jgi:hypothetical protein
MSIAGVPASGVDLFMALLGEKMSRLAGA